MADTNQPLLADLAIILASMFLITAETQSLPAIADVPGGTVLCYWDKDDEHYEYELFPDGRIEFFYLDRSTGQTMEEEFPYLLPAHIEHLKHLLKYQELTNE